MTDYQDALVLENLDLVNWVIRTRISIPNRPLLTYDDFYAIGCEAICRAALKYQPDMGAFAPFACRYIYNAIYGDRTFSSSREYTDQQRFGIRLSYQFNATKSKYKGTGAGASEKSRL